MAQASVIGLTHADFACECHSKSLDALFILARESDVSVAKALAISEVASIARTELRVQQLLNAKWSNRARLATARGAARAGAGGNAKAVSAEVDAVMSKWAADVETPFERSLADIYRYARIAAWKKGSGHTKSSLQYNATMLDNLSVSKAKGDKGPKARLTPKFDLVDERAVAALADDQMVWIGSFYAGNVRDTIHAAVRETMGAGLGRREAGRVMADVIAGKLKDISSPDGYRGSTKSYFEGLAANTATTARVRGHLRSFRELGVTKYMLVNPMDSRTSLVCQHMNGKTFLVSEGVKQVDVDAGVTDPDEMKRVHPWMSLAEIKELSKGPGDVSRADSKSLAESGLALPPYHFRCRTTVDVV